MQSAVGFEYQAGLSKHQSQRDGSKGFGGKYGVETGNQDAVRLCGVDKYYFQAAIFLINNVATAHGSDYKPYQFRLRN